MAAKKAKRGRPKLPDGRRERFEFRVSETELGVVMGAAEANGESPADWARRVLVTVAMGGGGRL